MKVQKDGSLMWTEIEDLAALIRSGKVRNSNPCLRVLYVNFDVKATIIRRSRTRRRSFAPATLLLGGIPQLDSLCRAQPWARIPGYGQTWGCAPCAQISAECTRRSARRQPLHCPESHAVAF